MSPAAQRLLSNKLNLKSTAISTPSPSHCLSSKSSASPYLSLLHSPSIRYNNTSNNTLIGNLRSTLKRPSNSITDNLLKLPKNA